jgi:hypothetical protein
LPLAFQILDVSDVGVTAGNHSQWLTVQREHGTHTFELASVRKVLHTFIGFVLNVRLHDAHVHFTTTDGVDVSHGAAAGRRVTADAVLVSVAIDQAANRLANDVIDAGLAAGVDASAAHPIAAENSMASD